MHGRERNAARSGESTPASLAGTAGLFDDDAVAVARAGAAEPVRGGRGARGPGAAADGVPRDVPPAGRVDAGLAGRERAGLDAREPAEAVDGGGPERGVAGGGAGHRAAAGEKKGV